LVKISTGADGMLDESRVRAVVKVLAEGDGPGPLRAYLGELEKFVAASTLRLEYCGELSDGGVESLIAHFEGKLGRRLAVIVEFNDALIAGLRVSVADTVVENSIAATLESYRGSTRRLSGTAK
jgi:F0F1-type ATP synthase delta subunit